jgi:hypothetical protein
MSTTPVRPALDGSRIEALSSIKKALEDATELIESLMIRGSHDFIDDPPNIAPYSTTIDEREVIDLTHSPQTDDDKENCGSDVVLGRKMTDNVATPSFATNTSTPDEMARSPGTMKASPMSSALSKVDGLARALKTINANGGRRDGKRSWQQAPMTAETEDHLEIGIVAPDTNMIGAIVLYEVRAKPYRTVVKAVDNNIDDKPWYDWKIFSVPGVLKLYCREDGATQLVLRTPMSGIVKLNLGIRQNIFDLDMNIPPKKKGRTEVGQVSFFAYENEGVLERFVLKVNRKELENLYGKLVELGARPTRKSG